MTLAMIAYLKRFVNPETAKEKRGSVHLPATAITELFVMSTTIMPDGKTIPPLRSAARWRLFLSFSFKASRQPGSVYGAGIFIDIL